MAARKSAAPPPGRTAAPKPTSSGVRRTSLRVQPAEHAPPSAPPGSVRAPADVAAHTFSAGGQEFLVLSYSLAMNEPPAELTDAERAVVAAVLEGRTNAAIASMRGTSPRTIANQLAAVFRKLGVRSRTELATRFLRVDGDARGSTPPKLPR
ncbi:MAG: helix-turn-helix transcriptional regulator [Polyangiaceae bacterium]